MKRHIQLFGIALTVLIIGCASAKPDSFAELRIAFGKKVEISSNEVIRVADHTKFKWDKLYIFYPYMNSEDIDHTLGVAWAKDKKIKAVGDGVYLFVFMENSNVVKHSYFAVDKVPGFPKNFNILGGDISLNPENAIF